MKKGLFYLIATAIFLMLLDYSTITCFYVILCAMLVGFLVDVIIDREWMKPLLSSCAWFFLIFMFYICMGRIHICQTDVGTDVYSPLYTRVLVSDVKKIDTLFLNSSIERWYDQLSPKQAEFYLVYKDEGLVHVFNRQREVMAADKKELSLSQRFWRGIPVDVIKIGDEYFDLNGKLIDESWYPITDVTPADPNL